MKTYCDKEGGCYVCGALMCDGTPRKILKEKERTMNAKQSLRAASKRIEELEYFNRRAAGDIKEYNACIDHIIAGGSPCDYCEDIEECQLKAKTEGIGCSEWMLRDPRPESQEDPDSKRQAPGKEEKTDD